MFGDHDLRNTTANEQVKYMDAILIHPQFTGFSAYQQDIALLHFCEPVTITDFVRPICLTRTWEEMDTYDNCWIAGWGRLFEGGKSENVELDSLSLFVNGGQFCTKCEKCIKLYDCPCIDLCWCPKTIKQLDQGYNSSYLLITSDYYSIEKQHIRPMGNPAHHHVGANCCFVAEPLHG